MTNQGIRTHTIYIYNIQQAAEGYTTVNAKRIKTSKGGSVIAIIGGWNSIIRCRGQRGDKGRGGGGRGVRKRHSLVSCAE